MKWLILILSLLLVTGCNEKKVIENENNQKVDTEEKEEDLTIVSENSLSNIEVDTSIQNTPTIEAPSTFMIDGHAKSVSVITEEHITNQELSTTNTSVLTEEDQTMQEIDSLEQEVIVLLADEQTETVKDKIVKKFITLVDFVYYDAPIGNVYFKNLTASAQEKVRSILARMDGAIESKIPNYKDTLKEKYQNVFNYVKTGASNLTTKANEKLESVMGSENYQNFVDAKDDMVESFQNTAGLIADGASKAYQSGKEKVSNWYQGLKEKYEE